MICPFRKMTETVDGTTREYYMGCYGNECPYYYKSKTYDEEECNRVTNEILGGNKS